MLIRPLHFVDPVIFSTVDCSLYNVKELVTVGSLTWVDMFRGGGEGRGRICGGIVSSSRVVQ